MQFDALVMFSSAVGTFVSFPRGDVLSRQCAARKSYLSVVIRETENKRGMLLHGSKLPEFGHFGAKFHPSSPLLQLDDDG